MLSFFVLSQGNMEQPSIPKRLNQRTEPRFVDTILFIFVQINLKLSCTPFSDWIICCNCIWFLFLIPTNLWFSGLTTERFKDVNDPVFYWDSETVYVTVMACPMSSGQPLHVTFMKSQSHILRVCSAYPSYKPKLFLSLYQKLYCVLFFFTFWMWFCHWAHLQRTVLYKLLSAVAAMYVSSIYLFGTPPYYTLSNTISTTVYTIFPLTLKLDTASAWLITVSPFVWS